MFGDKIAPLSILSHYWMILPLSFFVACFMTPVFRKIALKAGIMDMPDKSVKTHKEPTAYLGGLGILSGTMVGIALGAWGVHTGNIHAAIPKETAQTIIAHEPWVLILAIGIGAFIACMVGLLDDLYDLKPSKKFAGQAISAIVLIVAGIRPDLQEICLAATGWNMPDWVEITISAPIVLFFILAATNSLNLLDGLDGLCGGVTAIIVLAYFLLAWSLATWNHNPSGDTTRMIVSLSLVGGVLGFLPFNRHPAKIFMGDAGSMLLGYVAGALMILFAAKAGRWTIGSLIIFGLPILDTATALIRRYLNDKPLFLSDRGHIYDQLVDRGISKVKTVKICYLLSIVYAIAGLGMSLIRFRYTIPAFIFIFAVSFYIIWLGGFLQIPVKKEKKD